jgi:DMSO/TMAO reductase YedYZ molybdopterin-dependent catalytic subunit
MEVGAMALPPGQHRIEGFPRFGAHLSRPAPSVPEHPVLQVRGLVNGLDLPLSTLASLPRRELTADLHCVAGWSATDLRWEGVSFRTAYDALIRPALPPGTDVSHVLFRGLDGFASVLHLEDALADDVLLAEQLDGRPLDSDHGAPVRLVSPQQYGYMSIKHLGRIEVHASRPPQPGSHVDRLVLRLLGRHPRARVWHEERNVDLPAWAVRPVYRALIAPMMRLSARGSRT